MRVLYKTLHCPHPPNVIRSLQKGDTTLYSLKINPDRFKWAFINRCLFLIYFLILFLIKILFDFVILFLLSLVVDCKAAYML